MSGELLSQQQQTAARLLAIGNLDKQGIADSIGISRTTLWQWEKSGKLSAEVDRIKLEYQNFGKQLMENKLVDAVNGYWSLIQSTDNAMVAKSGYEYFIDRSLGKVTSKTEITLDAINTNQYNDNDIKQVFDTIEVEE
jgi:predicted DNA-binding protein YlxM (UPF0122 family)